MKNSFHLMPYCKKFAAGLLTAVLGLLLAGLMLLSWGADTLQINTKSGVRAQAGERRVCIGFDSEKFELIFNVEIGEQLQFSYSSTGLPA